MKKVSKNKQIKQNKVIEAKRVSSLIFGLFEFALHTVGAIALILDKSRMKKQQKSPKDAKKHVGVPTEDRISIPKRIVASCKDDVAKTAFTKEEQCKILHLRKNGSSIKTIAKLVHRRDRTVSAFLSSASK